MASLAISAAINIGTGILINALFPPDPIFGPQLTDLDVTSATYGQFVNIPFGTARMGGNIIWSEPIEEVSTETGGSLFKGGLVGGGAAQITFTYFGSFDVALAISGADKLLRVWGDGNLIADFTGDSESAGEAANAINFYPGGATQLQDGIESDSVGAAENPAYRHLTRIVFDRLPLADFGNRIPNITAEITYNGTTSSNFRGFVEAGGLNVPGSDPGGDFSNMAIDEQTNTLIALKLEPNGKWTADLTGDGVNMTLKLPSSAMSTYSGISMEPTYGHGFLYTGDGASNGGPLIKLDILTGVEVDRVGGDTVVTADTSSSVGNVGDLVVCRFGQQTTGFKHMLVHLNDFSEFGSIWNADNMTHVDILTTAEHLMITNNGNIIADDTRGSGLGVVYYVNDAGSDTDIIELKPDPLTFGSGVIPANLQVTARNTGSVDFPVGGDTVTGWAVLKETGFLILCNGSSYVLYDPATGTTLATGTAGAAGFVGRNNYVSGNRFAWTTSSQTVGSIFVIDPNTLELIDSFLITDLGFSSGPSYSSSTPSTAVWDDRGQAVVFSRVSTGASANGVSSPERIIRAFINRSAGLGVTLNTIVEALATSYRDIRMGGLELADLNTGELTDNVEGYVINRQSTLRDAMEPLRKAYFFDGIETDWMLNFPKRGSSSVVTIPEEQVGVLRRNDADPNFVKEIRQQEVELPMRLNFRYSNREKNYDIDVEHSKRHILPQPTMYSAHEATFEVPVIFPDGTIPKRAAEKWLYTMWNERRSWRTVLPWTYLKLDPADVFEMGLFGETLQLRMLEMDVGASLPLDIVGVQEDAFTFASTIAGTDVAGFINQNIPSSLPTTMLLLDAPLLSAFDLAGDLTDPAYVAYAGQEDTWPGAQGSSSLDNIFYSARSSASSEAAWGTVLAAPSAWGVDPDTGEFKNRFQTIAEGGTLIIIPARRSEAWTTATELQVLNDGNAFAVITPTGVEVIQYEVATPNADGTITLTKLLRGRLGTEDIADTNGPIVGNRVVLLSTADGSKEADQIAKNNLLVSELNSTLFWKAVTIGGLIEQSAAQSFIYTGRGLKPYTPVFTGFLARGDHTWDVDFERRTRVQGEWLDGTGAVPLNESIEQYEVTLDIPANPDFITKVVNNQTFAEFSKAELDAAGAFGGLAQTTSYGKTPDGQFDSDPDAGDWVSRTDPADPHGTWDVVFSSENVSAPPAGGGSLWCRHTKANSSKINSIISLDFDVEADLGILPEQRQSASVGIALWVAQDRIDDDMRIDIRSIDKDGGQTTLATTGTFKADTSLDTISAFGDWGRIGTAQDGTVYNSIPLDAPLREDSETIRIYFYGKKGGVTLSFIVVGFDIMELWASLPPAGLRAKVQQVSGSGLKSPIANWLLV